MDISGVDYKEERYKQVKSGDIAYNPYRINIGSIGVVPVFYDGMLVSPAYVVFRSKSKDFPANYIISILKSRRYRRIIMNYSLSSARACLPFSELIRIKIPKPSNNDVKILNSLQTTLYKRAVDVNEARQKISDFTKRYLKGD